MEVEVEVEVESGSENQKAASCYISSREGAEGGEEMGEG